ncbi:MAG: sensor histidine kinase [Ktedonobacteraceae bacterium]
MSMTDAKATHSIPKAVIHSPYILWMTWVIWLPFLIPATVSWLQLHPTLPRLIATLICLTLFTACYLWASLRRARRMLANTSSSALHTDAAAWLTSALLIVLSFTIAVLGNEHGYAWLSPFIFTSAYVSSRLSIAQTALTVGGLICGMFGLGWLLPLSFYDVGSAALTCIMVVVVVISVFSVIRANLNLRVAREEVERLAVTAERLRIARDLHDLLGHNLSLIALKSELARRLIAVSPERAAIEIGDIEQVARTTLQEVREAVSSYRQPALTSELEAAQEILAAAGITYKYQGNERMLHGIPPTVEAILSWAVREGVTNVVKHSRAKHCLISLTRDEHTIGVEVADDGRALSSVSEDAGNGLRGLAERVKAVDGQFEAASRPIGGFRLAITLPLMQRQHVANGHVSGTATPTGIIRVLDEVPGDNN